MKKTVAIIRQAFAQARKPALAISGGQDSLVLLDITARLGFRPVLIHADSQLEYPETLPFIESLAALYHLPLYIARARKTPPQVWARSGYPFLGKLAARIWNQEHAARAGFRLGCSECCRTLKISPARSLTRRLGCDLQLTGQRGAQDDAVRSLRASTDGHTFFHSRDRLWISNPLTGWTDLMIRRYSASHSLPQHPMRSRGAISIGCAVCAGGARFSNSPFPALRREQPELWRSFIIHHQAGLITLALKYNQTLPTVQAAVNRLGGLPALAAAQPWIFDFSRIRPIPGYDK